MPQDLYLTLNAAEKHTQYLISALEKDNEGNFSTQILFSEMSTQPKASTEFLIQAIDIACQKLGISIKDINHIAAITGPGNFMGIRLIAVTASALARAIPITAQAPLDYMQALAQNIPVLATLLAQIQNTQDKQSSTICFTNKLQELSGKSVRIVTTATKDSVHICDFTFKEERGQIVPEPNFPTMLYELANKNAYGIENTTQTKTHTNFDKNSPDFILGSGLQAHEEYFRTHFPSAIFMTETILQEVCNKLDLSSHNTNAYTQNLKDYYEIPLSFFAHTPSIQSLHFLTISKYTKWQEEDLTPLYIKECDALQNLDHIATMQGRAPKDAHAHLEKLMHTPL